MAVNRRLLKERLNLNPGLNQKTKPAKQSHLKLFSKDSQPGDTKWRSGRLRGSLLFPANKRGP